MLHFFSNLADFIGIVAFALSGLLATRDQSNLDPVGVFVLAFTTAFGGGIIRDIIIRNETFWFVENEHYVWLTIVLTILTPSLVRRFRKDTPYSWFIWADAIGLGFFAAGGAAISCQHGIPMLSSTLLGVTTGAAGGMLRDVILNKLPLVLSDRKPYALAAFAGSWLTELILHFTGNTVLAVWVGAFFICGMRMLCWYKNWEIRYNQLFAIISGK